MDAVRVCQACHGSENAASLASLGCEDGRVLSNEDFKVWMECLSARELSTMRDRRRRRAEHPLNGEEDGEEEEGEATLHGLVRGGVPSGLRATVWPVLLRVSRECPPSEAFEQSPDMLELMEHDVPRTFSSNAMVQTTGFQTMLKATLVAAGPYQQGLSFVASVLLRHVTMLDAALCLKEILVNPFYGLSALDAEEPRWITSFESVFSLLLPRVFRFLQSRMIDVSMVVCKWLRTAFSEVLPDPILVRVWDLYFVHGLDFLFRVAVVLFSLMQNELLAPENATASKLMPLINDLPAHAVANVSSPEQFVERCFDIDRVPRDVQSLFAVL